jgi:ribonuclease HI
MPESVLGSDNLSATIPTQVDVYTDGGCDPNPGPGGWGAIIRWNDREWVISGNDLDTTNNRMELQAAAAALALLGGLLGRCQARIHTDSQYLRQGITAWLDGWVEHGWRTKEGQPVKNQDLWRVLHQLTRTHDVTWKWIKGHAGHPLNERADRIATEARRALRQFGSSRAASRRSGAPSADTGPSDRGPLVEIFVKASCRGAKGLGGWAAILRIGDRTKSLSGSEPSTTANAMLIRGATEALRALTKPCRVTVYSDAKYLIDGASLWVRGWQSRGWRTKDGRPVANRAAWEELVEAAQPHHVTWSLAQGDDVAADLAWAAELATESAKVEEAVSDQGAPDERQEQD